MRAKSEFPTRHGDQHLPDGSDPIDFSFGGPRIVAGQIYNDANIIAGTGFTAEWADQDGSSPGTNLITIRFDVPFDDPPTVVLTGNNNNPADVEGEYQLTQKSVAVDYVVAIGLELDGTPNIGGFNFVAVETEPAA